MRLITEEEMTETVKRYEVRKGLFILRLQQIIDTHKVQNTPLITMMEWVRKIEKDFKDV